MKLWIAHMSYEKPFCQTKTADHIKIHRSFTQPVLNIRSVGLSVVKRRRSISTLSAKKQNTFIQVESQPLPSTDATAARSTSSWLVPAGLILVAAVGAYFFLRNKVFPKNLESAKEAEEKIYAAALARTRQAIYVHRAIGFMNTNSPARVMVELERALKENSVCRSELVSARHSQEELQGLYRMHLLNEEVPSNYAILLQLREMLGVPAEIADSIEKEINQVDAFDI